MYIKYFIYKMMTAHFKEYAYKITLRVLHFKILMVASLATWGFAKFCLYIEIFYLLELTFVEPYHNCHYVVYVAHEIKR